MFAVPSAQKGISVRFSSCHLGENFCWFSSIVRGHVRKQGMHSLVENFLCLRSQQQFTAKCDNRRLLNKYFSTFFLLQILVRRRNSVCCWSLRRKSLPWRCIQRKPSWRASSNPQTSGRIHTATVGPITRTTHTALCRPACPWRRWHPLDYHMVSMPLASRIKVCGVNMASKF